MKGLSRKNCPVSCKNTDTIIITDVCTVHYVPAIVLSACLDFTHEILTIMLLVSTNISSILKMRKLIHKKVK